MIAASAAPQLPKFEEFGQKSDAALVKLQEQAKNAVENLRKSYEELVTRGNNALATITKALLEKSQQVLDALTNRLNKIAGQPQKRSAVDEFFANLQKKADEATVKVEELKTQFAAKAQDAKDQAVENLKKATAQAEQLMTKVEELAMKEQEAAIKGFETADAKVKEVKGKLVNLLDVLEKKYFELREAGKKMEGNLREKRAQLLSKVKEMISTVQSKLRGEKKEVKRQINWNELIEGQISRLNETMSKLRERMEDATGKAKEVIHQRIDSLKTLLENLQERVRAIGGKKEKREVPSFEKIGQQVNEKVSVTQKNVEELRSKIQALVADIKVQAETLKKSTQERVKVLLNQLKDAVNALTGKKNVEKREVKVPDFVELGKNVDKKIDELKNMIEKNLNEAIKKVNESAQVVSDRFNQAKEHALNVANEKVEMAKKAVEELLARAA